MTDNEIIQALECCTTNGASCKDCPAFVKVDRSNCKKYFRGAFDLIKRQKAEIEFLKQDALTPVVTKIGDEVARREKIKAEAVKEFAKKIKDTTWYHINSDGKLVEGANGESDVPLYKAEDILKIAKEMVGDNDAKD